MHGIWEQNCLMVIVSVQVWNVFIPILFQSLPWNSTFDIFKILLSVTYICFKVYSDICKTKQNPIAKTCIREFQNFFFDFQCTCSKNRQSRHRSSISSHWRIHGPCWRAFPTAVPQNAYWQKASVFSYRWSFIIARGQIKVRPLCIVDIE